MNVSQVTEIMPALKQTYCEGKAAVKDHNFGVGLRPESLAAWGGRFLLMLKSCRMK